MKITRGFWLFDTPVKQELWEAVVGENPAEFNSRDRPVERVSWNDCQKFFEELQDLAPEIEFSLPTEAEWEYACWAGSETEFSFGDDESSKAARGFVTANTPAQAIAASSIRQAMVTASQRGFSTSDFARSSILNDTGEADRASAFDSDSSISDRSLYAEPTALAANT